MTEIKYTPVENETLLDRAFQSMQADPDNEKARLRFYAEFADVPLTLLLTEAAGEDSISPHMFETGEGSFVLAFDTEERLADFARSLEGGAAEYAQIPGRALVGMLEGQGVGIALNPGVAASEFLFVPETIDWLLSVLGQAPVVEEARPGDISEPGQIGDELFQALSRAMRSASGLAGAAYLVKAVHRGGTEGLMLALLDVDQNAESALAGSVSNAVQFLGDQDLRLDVIFPEKGSPFAAQIARTGTELTIPAVEQPETTGPSAPGMDPARPPKLK